MMRLPWFEFREPRSVAEAAKILAGEGPAAMLIAGGTVLLLEGFDAETLVGLLEAGRLDTFFAVPTVYQALLDHPRFTAPSRGTS